MITNPTPITPGTFGGMWISKVELAMPDLRFPAGFLERRGKLLATLLPYDGVHLLATGGKSLQVHDLAAGSAADARIAGLVGALCGEAGRQSGKTGVTGIAVHAPDPSKPVRVVCRFGHETFIVPDGFGLCAEDPQFASVFTTVMGTVAVLAGLEVTA
jgi:hypothetical protein